MSLKHDILKELELNRGKYYSGQALAERFGVSRAAVWKAVKGLIAEGTQIAAVPNLGYCVCADSDALTAEGIQARLKEEYRAVPIELMRIVDSTNNELKRRSSALNPDYILLSEEQSGGRGRSGKTFFSPPFTSIYISFLLNPKKLRLPVSMVTTAAAVAVSEAVKKSTGVETTVKWVNDIYFGDKKIVGILTEAVTSIESGETESLILGIGLNCHWDGVEIPKEIAEVATSIDTDVARNFIAAEIVNCVYDVIYGGTTDVLDYARKHSYLLGKTVEYTVNGIKKIGKATELDDEGHLVVTLPDGCRDVLTAGEVSVKKVRQ